ncbi:MAG: SDR family oxidoreductase [Vulcanimicrobiaceae bacterium]
MRNKLDLSKELIGRRALVTGGKANPGFSPAGWLRHIPLGRIGDAEDIAEAVALLVSDRGKFITGVNYRVDSGMTAA